MVARPHPRPNAGFTLVEMLVALLIFSTIAVAGTAMTRFVLAGRGDLAERQARTAELQTARALIRADLLHALARPSRDPYGGSGGRGFTGGDGAVGDGVLSFVRGGWDNPGALEDRGPLLRVEYVLAGDALVRRAVLRPDPTVQTPVVETPLVSGVRRLSLRFLSGGRWADGWAGADTLPEAVALEMDLAGLGEVRQLFLTGEGAR